MSSSPGADSQDQVTVLGAGIVGVCCALSLQERGYAVTMVDRGEPGGATSHGNAGVISPWSCVPQCMPGLWTSIPKWMLDPNGPLRVRLLDLPETLPWAFRFLANCRENRVREISETMAFLMRDNVTAYKRHLKGTDGEGLLRDSWFVNAFRASDAIRLQDLSWRLRVEQGAPIEVVEGGVLHEIEPELSAEYRSAVVIKDQARAYAPGTLCRVLADKARGQGATFLRREVTDLKPNSDGGYDLLTNQGTLSANKLVVCGGIWSQGFLRTLGFKLPLISERGYHVEFDDPGVALNHSILDVEAKFIASSMKDGVRSAGMSEFARQDAPPIAKRTAALKRLSKRLLPRLNVGSTRNWVGARPSFPDSLPVIGEVPRFPGLYVAFGHSHYGLGMAPATGKLIAEALDGVQTNRDPTRLGIERFL